MKKLFALILTFLCLLTMLSIPALAADAGVEPYGTPGSGYDQKKFYYNNQEFTAYFYLQFDSSYYARSKCVTEAIVEVSHGTLTVQFTTGEAGIRRVPAGASTIRHHRDRANRKIGRRSPIRSNIMAHSMWQPESTIWVGMQPLMAIRELQPLLRLGSKNSSSFVTHSGIV